MVAISLHTLRDQVDPKGPQTKESPELILLHTFTYQYHLLK